MNTAKVSALMGKYQFQKLKTGNLRTCPFRISYPALLEPSKDNGNGYTPKHGVTMLFPKGANLKLLEDAIRETATTKWGPKVNMGSLRLPLRDQGTKDKMGYEAGAMFARANSDSRPNVVDANRNPITDKKACPAGYWAIATINPYAGEKGGKGVHLGLQNVIIIAADETFSAQNADPDEEFGDIEPIDGSMDAEAEFEDEEMVVD